MRPYSERSTAYDERRWRIPEAEICMVALRQHGVVKHEDPVDCHDPNSNTKNA
jgi:hypothetical protein